MLFPALTKSCVLLTYYTCGIMYPLFRSSRICRGKEVEENKEVILKFWVCHCILRILQYYFENWFIYFDIGDLSIAILHVVLVIGNFKVAEMFYDNIIKELFHKSEWHLH